MTVPSFSIFLPKRLFEKLRSDARRQGKTCSQVIRAVLEEYYSRREWESHYAYEKVAVRKKANPTLVFSEGALKG